MHGSVGDTEVQGLDAARAVAEAILYEGYLLYPYRRSSGKNRVRWQFGVLSPRAWVEAAGPADESVAGSADAWYQQTDCLLEAPQTTTVRVRVRFLQVQQRSVQAFDADGFHTVDALEVDGRDHLSFSEAVPHEFDITVAGADLVGGPHVEDLLVPGGEDREALGERARVLRERWPVSVSVHLSLEPAQAPFGLRRLRVRTENAVTGVAHDLTRDEALRRSAVATHTLIGLSEGRFLSLLEAPEWAAAAVRECRNVHTFPVLAGEADGRDVMLSSPILMDDHPQVAPESPGDLFDATEIDEILSLRTLALTDAEKEEARATDPRAAAIIDRVDAMPDAVMDRLHGAVRSLRPIRTEVCPDTDSVVVDGVRIQRGSQVLLRPRTHGTDPQDRFLVDRAATVQAVMLDLDGDRQIAVTVDDDPGADVHEWYGRYHYFRPDEVRPAGRGG